MATSKGKKISEVAKLQEFTGAEMIPLAINGSNYTCTVDALKEYVYPDLSGYVTTDTEQTISQRKTFTSGISFIGTINISQSAYLAFGGIPTLRNVNSAGTNITYLCAKTSPIRFRPNGFSSTDGQVEIDTDGIVTANGFKVPDGTSSQFLKADGSLDETEYVSELMTSDEASELYNKIYAEILEEYGDEIFPNPLTDKDNE